MSRYIDADAMIANALQDSERLYLESVAKHAPSIDLVRCGECRWYKDFDGCFFSTAEVEEDGFCSYGEREDE